MYAPIDIHGTSNCRAIIELNTYIRSLEKRNAELQKENEELRKENIKFKNKM